MEENVEKKKDNIDLIHAIVCISIALGTVVGSLLLAIYVL